MSYPITGNPLSILWVGSATITEFTSVTDATTHKTTNQPTVLVSNEPCRVSYRSEQPTNIQDGAAIAYETITLFIRPDLSIKSGSIISVTQNGVTTEYERASKPIIYSDHQEIGLKLKDGNA